MDNSPFLKIDRPGMDTWIVDLGRPGFRDQGVSPGGPADSFAHHLANALLENDPTAATLEFSLIGPTLTLTGGPIYGVLTGAVDRGYLDDRLIVTEKNFRWYPGQTLRMEGMTGGCRGYLGVSGGLMAHPILGSRLGLGPVSINQVIPVVATPAIIRRPTEPVWELKKSPIRVLAGPESSEFDLDGFYGCTWRCSSLVNRMGCRLEGNAIQRKTQKEMLSEPVLPGVIQINHGGFPMVLGIQCQTIGGYPRIACVIRADLDKVGQLRPGDSVDFQLVDQNQAGAAWKEKKRTEGVWLNRLRPSLSS